MTNGLGSIMASHGAAGRAGLANVLLPLRWVRVFVVVAQIRWIIWSTFIPHNRTVWSLLPVAMVCPSGLNATEMIELVWPVRG
jgi:hypothetical protein